MDVKEQVMFLCNSTFAYDRREDARALMIMIQGPVVSP